MIVEENKKFGHLRPGAENLIYVRKENSYPAPVLEGEGPIIFLAHGDLGFLGVQAMPKNTQNDVFLGAFNGFLAGEPRLGCRNMDFRFLSA
jgi:hypothetical protein